MQITTLSEKQKLLFKWAHTKEYCEKYDNIICDGAVRSGKTVIMAMSFIIWAMRYFDDCSFAICSKTASSCERNIISVITSSVDLNCYYSFSYNRTSHVLNVNSGEHHNRFYIFGGKDEASYMQIQGITLCGVMFDEAALMPRSFVEQAVARTLSEPNARLWFNCNPASPSHWLYREWIKDADGENRKRTLHLRFFMEDNPILTEKEIKKARTMYSGVFYSRYIKGEWVNADGLVYPMFSSSHITDVKPHGEYYISIDYGTANPCSMGLWCVGEGTAVRVAEYYHDSRISRIQKTDEEYCDALCALADGCDIKAVIVDPSAASFIEALRKRGRFRILPAKNKVLDGIRFVSSLLQSGKLKFDPSCKDIIREFGLYSWDESQERDSVIKQFDHAMDDMRYFCSTVLKTRANFGAKSKSKQHKHSSLGAWEV